MQFGSIMQKPLLALTLTPVGNVGCQNYVPRIKVRTDRQTIVWVLLLESSFFNDAVAYPLMASVDVVDARML
jgi:hypothetical protein